MNGLFRRTATALGSKRSFSTSLGLRAPGATEAPVPNSRWLADLRKRLNGLESKDISSAQKREVQQHLALLNEKWLELSAGQEGYLTEPKWRGLDRHSLFWGDMDSMVSHVNNVMYNRWAESGRVNYVQNIANAAQLEQREEWASLMTPRGIGLILASIKTDYKFPMTYPDKVTVMHKLVEKPGYTSNKIILEAVAYSERHQRLAARFVEDIAVYDYRLGKKAPLKPFMVEELQKMFEMQSQSQQAASSQIAEINSFAERLEQ